MMFSFIFILFFLLSPSRAEAKIYKYTDAKGVVSFTDQIESIPPSLRHQMETLETSSSTSATSTQSAEGAKSAREEQNPRQPISSDIVFRQGFFTPFVKYSLMMVIAILLFFCLKLWIKNMILKFIARIAIKIALVGLLYVMVYYLLVSPERNLISSTVHKATEKAAGAVREIAPLKKAKENIEQFNKVRKEQKETLDAIESNP